MAIRDWIITQLCKDSQQVESVGEHGVKVLRSGRPNAVAYCVEPDSRNSFSVEALEVAVEELPEAGMVIITRRLVDPDVYDRASHLGVCVDTFGGFQRAIRGFDDIAQYVHPEENYVRRRMASTRAVESIVRRGYRAWELKRFGGLRPLTIVTHDRYELTDDGFAEVLSQYPKIALDALVVTNPSAQGFGDRVVKSAHLAGVPLYRMDDFVAVIRQPWT